MCHDLFWCYQSLICYRVPYLQPDRSTGLGEGHGSLGRTNLIDDVTRLVGPGGNVWAVGAQNAGKSTLINAIGAQNVWKHVSKKVVTQAAPITEAPVPGTTLGIIRMEGILPGKAKLFDTPGLLLPHNIDTRLTRDEQKLVQICKELRPRTCRIQLFRHGQWLSLMVSIYQPYQKNYFSFLLNFEQYKMNQ